MELYIQARRFALTSVTEGDENTAVGYDALTSLTTGHKNVSVGVGALNSLTTGHGNMGLDIMH